jgi:predicted nucleic acid-binding protein
MGVQVHDARIAASMNAHGITHLLTFNSGDFKRFQGIIALSPQDVITAARPQQPADS